MAPLAANYPATGAIPRDVQGTPMQTHRGFATSGLRYRPIGRWEFEVTAGATGTDTFNLTANGVSLAAAPVAWVTSNGATATAIATAINANSANTGFYATVSGSTVTIRQRVSGAVTMAKVVVGDADGTLTAAFASSDSWTEVLSGATLDGDEYYQLSWSGSLVVDVTAGVDLSGAMVESIRLMVVGQAFQLWSGKGVQTAANVVLTGHPVTADTWTNKLPWLAGLPLIIKLAADAPLLYEVLYV